MSEDLKYKMFLIDIKNLCDQHDDLAPISNLIKNGMTRLEKKPGPIIEKELKKPIPLYLLN